MMNLLLLWLNVINLEKKLSISTALFDALFLLACQPSIVGNINKSIMSVYSKSAFI